MTTTQQYDTMTRLERARELDERMRQIARRSTRNVIEAARSLAENATSGLFEELTYSSITAHSKAVFGYSPTKTRDLVRIIRKSPPKTRAAFDAGLLPWTAARELIKVATDENEEEWLGRAARLSVDELRLEVAVAMGKQPKGAITLRVTTEEQLDLEAFDSFMRPYGFTRRGAALAEAARRIMAGASSSFEAKSVAAIYDHCEGCGRTTREGVTGPVQVPSDAATRSVDPPERIDRRSGATTAVTAELGPRLVRTVKTADTVRCEVPRCWNRSWSQLHLQPDPSGGAQEPCVVSLCKAHFDQRRNEKLRIEVERTVVRFRRRDGTLLTEVPALASSPGAWSAAEPPQASSAPSSSSSDAA